MQSTTLQSRSDTKNKQKNQIREETSEITFKQCINDQVHKKSKEKHAIDDGLDDEDCLELQRRNNHLSSKEKPEQAKENYKQRTHNCDIVEPTTLHIEIAKLHCHESIPKIAEFTIQAQPETDKTSVSQTV